MMWKNVIKKGFVSPTIDPTTSLSDAVTIATDAVAQHLKSSNAVRLYLINVPKGEGTSCPDSPIDELIKYVAIQKGQMDKSDPTITLPFIKDLVMPVFDFERKQVLKAIFKIDDINELYEIAVFDYCALLSMYHDRLWAKWFEAIVIPYQSLSEEDQKAYEECAKDQLAQYDYTVFDFDQKKGCVNRQTWASAFPDDIDRIVTTIDILAKRYTELGFNEFWSALRDAYACADIDALEGAWSQVDWAWIKMPTTARIVPVHGMESGYEHPFGVSPEFRLEVRTSEAREVIEGARSGTVGHAKAFGMSDKLVDLVSQKLNSIDISVFTCAFRSGVSLNFRIAGQAVPNRQEVLAQGGKIFLNEGAPRREEKQAFENLDKHCVPKTAKKLKGLINLDVLLAHTIDHEFSHPVGCTPESDEALGGDVKNLLEEGKATTLGLLADEWSTSTPENRAQLMAVTVARVLRFMHNSELDDVTFAAYVRENLVSATTLFKSGVLELTKDGVIVNFGDKQNKVWFEHLRIFNRALLKAYEAHDQDAIRQLTDMYCDKTNEPVAGLIKWVNRD